MKSARLIVMMLLGTTLAPALMLTGCSRTAMSSNPFWDSETGKVVAPTENSVNVWPIFYYRNPALSVLWPLISATDEGSAFIPAYEHDKTRDELRLGTVHQVLPAAAVFSGREQYTRILNCVRDRKEDKLAILPLYFQNFRDSSLLIIPAYYGDKEGFWTPLMTKTKDLTGVLGPFFNVWKSGATTYYNMPFPLAGVKRGADENGFWMLPAVYYDRTGPTSHLNLAGALLDLEKNGQSWEAIYAGLLGGAARKANGDGHNYLIPLWVAWAGKGEKGFLSLPYSSYREGDYRLTAAGFNAWIETRDKNGFYQSVFWPVFHRFQDPERRGLALLPLFYTDRHTNGDRMLVTPLGGAARSGDAEYLNVGGPFYFSKRDRAGSYTTVAWPLAHIWTGNAEKGAALLPLFYFNRSQEGKVLVTPLGGGAHTPDGDIFDLAGPLFFQHRDARAGTFYRTAAWPLWHESETKNSKSKTLLPLFHFSKGAEGFDFVSLPYSTGRDKDGEHYVNVGGLLLHRETGPDKSATYLLADLIGWENYEKAGRHESHVFPFYDAEETPEQRHINILLSGFTASKKDESALRREMLNESEQANHYHWSHRTLKSRHALGFLYTSKEDLIGREEGLRTSPNEKPPHFVVRKEREKTIFPLAYHHELEGEGAETNVLWRLYDSTFTEKGPHGAPQEVQRVLWRVYHRTAEGENVSVDVFPFMTYDHTKEWSRFSFAGGLFGGGQKDGKGYTQVFWVKF